MVAVLLLLAACGPSGTPIPLRSCRVDPPDRAVLHADGTVLRDAAGRAITLRGVNAGGRSKLAPYMPFDYPPDGFQAALDAYLDRAESYGFDVLRVPFSWAALEPAQGQDDAAWLARYDALLRGAWARGMWTIVDFHQDVYAKPFCGDGFPVWTLSSPPVPRTDCANWFEGYLDDRQVADAFDAFWAPDSPVMAEFEAMWDRMAAHEAEQPGVIGFEVINEPYQGSADVQTWDTQTMPAFYTALAARIRAAAPGRLVFFDASGLDGAAAHTGLARPDGDGLVFAPHYYDPGIYTGAADLAADVPAAVQSWQEQGQAWDVPVLLGEYGIPSDHPQAAAYVGAVLDALDAAGMGGTYWEYSDSAQSWNGEAFSLVDTSGVEQDAVLGALVRPYVRAVAGRVLARDHAPDGTFQVQIASDGGTSEIVLPTRIFSATADIEATRAACGELRDGVLYVRAPKGRTFTVRARP